MSWDVELLDPNTNKVVEFDDPLDLQGGTYAIGNCTSAWFNITYNYSRHFHGLNDGELGSINGRPAGDTIPELERAISLLGNDVSRDYWASTEGNAKRALNTLLAMAKQRPDGIWSVQ